MHAMYIIAIDDARCMSVCHVASLYRMWLKGLRSHFGWMCLKTKMSVADSMQSLSNYFGHLCLFKFL